MRRWLPTASCLLPPAHCLLFPITRAHSCLNISAHVEVAFDFYAQRIAGVHKIFEDHVDYVLVKDLNFAKRIDVQLQTLQLDAAFVRNVFKPNRGEVREIRERADASKFRNLKIDFDFSANELVRKSVERIEIHLCARRRTNLEALNVRRLCRWAHFLKLAVVISIRRSSSNLEYFHKQKSVDEAANVRRLRDAACL